MFESFLFIGLPTVIAVLLAVGTYLLAARRFQPQLTRLREGTSRHPVMSLLLILYGMVGGIMLGLAFFGEFSTPVGSIMLVLPLLAGCCAGWWQLWSDAAPSTRRSIIDQGMLAGLLVTVLPATLALILIVMAGGWWYFVMGPFVAGESPGWWYFVIAPRQTAWWHALWMILPFVLAGAFVMLGVVLGALGALLSVRVYHWRHRGGPTAPLGVS